MSGKILIFYGSYRSDRQGILLAEWLVRAFPRFADDLGWWTEAARVQRLRAPPPY